MTRRELARETMLYRIVTHELGHALGLRHARDPRSLMCCDPHVDFSDRRFWTAYVEALLAREEAIRNPDVRSVREQLAEHYVRFWSLDSP